MLSLSLEHHILEAKTLSPHVSVTRCMLLWHLADARTPEQQNTFNMPKFAYENLYQGSIRDIANNEVFHP